ncbi:MAG: hypothetical protein H0U76_18580 [Ktedonobacteraceae bacterium]|nr:hypothetical protein [Ktedonobacteraceae bacterium]
MLHLLSLLKRFAIFRVRHPFWYQWAMVPSMCFVLVVLGLFLGHVGIGLITGVVLARFFDLVIVTYQLYSGDEGTEQYSLTASGITDRVHMWEILRRKILFLW